MKKSVLILFFVTVIAAGLASNAFAWDDVGHKITAYAAWQRMTPATRENVIRVLRQAPEDAQLSTFYALYGPEPEETRKREFFELVASWADIVRDRAFDTRYKKYHKSNWHYDDIFWRQIDGKAQMVTGMEEGGQGVKRLIEFDKELRDPSTPDKEKAIAIAWLMHIGGDLHQPLHTSGRVTDLEPKGDQGGNLFLLTPQGTPRADQLNLHWFWDSIVSRSVPPRGEICGRQYVEQTADRMMKRFPFSKLQLRLELGRYEDWKQESFDLNTTQVFRSDLKRNQIPTASYRKNAFLVAEQQLMLAGYRLGETLNSIFGNMQPPTRAAN